ncbi:Uncharacterised protein [Mycobacteroides abscessus subsp. abscessus]|nr:Uncharacterised protein [Mycobacteroides abscessus subsp. abscessus]
MLARCAFEVDVLLTSRRETGNAHLGRGRDLVLRQNFGGRFDSLWSDPQRPHGADLDATQRDILTRQQAARLTQFHRDSICGRKGVGAQRPDAQICHRQYQSQYQCQCRQHGLLAMAGAHRSHYSISDGVDHRPGPGAGGTDSITPGSVGLGLTGASWPKAPLPTTRSCSRHNVYLTEPASCAQL